MRAHGKPPEVGKSYASPYPYKKKYVLDARPLPDEFGKCKTVKARFWPWLSGEYPDLPEPYQVVLSSLANGATVWDLEGCRGLATSLGRSRYRTSKFSTSSEFPTELSTHVGVALLHKTLPLQVRTLNPQPPTLNPETSCASMASLRTGVYSTCGPISPCSGRDCVKSLRSSYKGLCPQTNLETREGRGRVVARGHISREGLPEVDVPEPCGVLKGLNVCYLNFTGVPRS